MQPDFEWGTLVAECTDRVSHLAYATFFCPKTRYPRAKAVENDDFDASCNAINIRNNHRKIIMTTLFL